ncbi:uncharacterized protein A1O9_01328 [Exophiala aquamarina CBS 119918]|uniref:Uncharacterized protein n=1 Tax=Exophiala aquamarina CBS 119918 TaxID=1182545 RepID=A0A072PU29_9EURO|nr:uncharacterized protein A1O9_01328 [Exophiala aquamarina CBS 119918]KEF63351.1 hypothetical protein A1O9_01328 [Exophiala aquamarina CBS 119918]
MSSTSSVDSSNAYKLSDTSSIKYSGDDVRTAKDWIDRDQSRSGNASLSASPSPSGSITDIDLDLDSFFKRLDKYTAEMEEVEARLKRNRRLSDDSDQINIKRFSFEINQLLGDDRVLLGAPAGSPKTGSSQTTSSLVSGAEGGNNDVAERNNENLEGETGNIEDSFLIIQSNALPHHGQITRLTTGSQLLVSGRMVTSNRASLESGCDLHIPIQNNVREEASDRSIEPIQVKPTNKSEVQLLIERPSFSSLTTADSPGSELRQEATTDRGHDQSLLPEAHYIGQENRSEEIDYSDIEEPYPATPVGWTFPPRTSSKTFPTEEASGKTEESPSQPPRQRMKADNRQSVRHGGFWSAPPLLLLDREPILPVPSLPQSGSTVTISSSPPLTPLSLCSPREDQIRRELESFALHEGAKTLKLKYKKRRPRRLDLVDFDGEAWEVDEERESWPELEKREVAITEPSRSRPRRSKSIMSIFQRRSPIEKVIDLYFDDEPKEKPHRPLSRWTTISRKGSPTTANMPRSPPIPPLRAISPGFEKASIG